MKKWQRWLIEFIYIVIVLIVFDLPKYLLNQGVTNIWFDLSLLALYALGVIGAYLTIAMKKTYKKAKKK